MSEASAAAEAKRPKCPCCGEDDRLELLATSTFYVAESAGGTRDLVSTLYDCRRCDLILRDLNYDDPGVKSHYNVASYTSEGQMERFYRERIGWFRWFARQTIRRSGREKGRMLDFGCSYGHLMDCFVERGWEVLGVEIAAPALECLARYRPEYRVVRSLEEVEPGWPDVFIATDSFYCVERPRELVDQAARLLPHGGMFAGRVVKRNYHLRLFANKQRRRTPPGTPPSLPYSLVGDAKTYFSPQSLRRTLEGGGFGNVQFVTREPGKRRGLRTMLMYNATWLAEALTLGRLPLATGLQFWCTRPTTAAHP